MRNKGQRYKQNFFCYPVAENFVLLKEWGFLQSFPMLKNWKNSQGSLRSEFTFVELKPGGFRCFHIND